MKSWRKTLTGMLVALLLVLLLFLLGTNVNYYFQAKDNIQRKNIHTVEVWKSSVETRLNMLYEHLYELLLTIYNNTELSVGTPMMKYATQQKCLDMMKDKLLINEDVDCFYIQDSSSTLQLFSANNRIKSYEAVALKNYFYSTVFNDSIGLNSTDWSIAGIGGEAYFIKTVSLGKYTVGLASSFSNYDIDTNFSVMGSEMSCLIVEEENIYPVSDEDWSEQVCFSADGNAYFSDKSIIVAETTLDKCGAQVLLGARQDVFRNGETNSVLLICGSALCFALFLILLFFIKRTVVQPMQKILRANQELSGDNPNYRIMEKANSLEFAALFDSFNKMADSLYQMRIESYDRKLSEQKNELQMLRAQLRPHFYLNAITTVMNMTYQDRNEDIRTYLAALAKYMRYMLNYQSKWVTVREEVAHIKSYFEMQKIKFPGSIDAYVGCSESVADTKIPYLLLFTVVENTFKHAMDLYKPLQLLVQCESISNQDFRGCRMIVEDNGKGFSDEVLNAFAPQDDNSVPTAKDHFGLTNISRTLQLIYHRNDLLQLSNAPTGGAHVEIWIPEDSNETLDL